MRMGDRPAPAVLGLRAMKILALATPFLVTFLLALPSVCPQARAADDTEGAPRRIPLDVGDEAPDFTLPSPLNPEVHLASFRGKNVVVLYFYPKDFTPGCTKEAEDFRDDAERFKKAGAVVLGVSVDDVDSHKQFTNKMNLNFQVLSDVGGAVSRKYGVMGWIMAKRVTYVIGRDGKIKNVFPDVDQDLAGHSKAVLKAVQELGGEKAAPVPAGKGRKSKSSKTAPSST